MRFKESSSELEKRFDREIELDRRRRAGLHQQAKSRTVHRRLHKQHKKGSVRFVLLVLSMITTAVVVAVVMFEVLLMLMG